MMIIWPAGWVCHTVRAPGAKVTLAVPTRLGASAIAMVSTRTAPVKLPGTAPDFEGAAALRVMFISRLQKVSPALR